MVFTEELCSLSGDLWGIKYYSSLKTSVPVSAHTTLNLKPDKIYFSLLIFSLKNFALVLTSYPQRRNLNAIITSKMRTVLGLGEGFK